jgi:hypothetical protein
MAMRAATSWRCSARTLRELAGTGARGLIPGCAEAIARWLEEGGGIRRRGRTADPGGGACAKAN